MCKRSTAPPKLISQKVQEGRKALTIVQQVLMCCLLSVSENVIVIPSSFLTSLLSTFVHDLSATH